MDMKLEVVVLPVSDVDRAKDLYTQQMGFRLDADFPINNGYRIVQVTPPGSACSIIFGTGVAADAEADTVQGLHLGVSDIEQALRELASCGIDVTGPFHDVTGAFHLASETDRVTGLHPQRASYGSFASFSDPDGNGWILQEITERLPGR